MTDIGTLAIHHLTLHDWFPTIAYNLAIFRNVSNIFEHAQNVTTACDTLRLLKLQPTESQRVSHYTTSCRRRRHGGPSQVVVHVSSKSCSVRLLLDMPHSTRFLWSDASDRIRYEMTGNRRGSCHLTEIGTLVVQTTWLITHDCVFMR